MDRAALSELMNSVARGETSPDAAVDVLSVAPIRDLGYAQVDLQRELRQGVSEVIYGAGKTAEEITGIAHSLIDAGQSHVLITRIDAAKEASVAAELKGVLPYAYHPRSQALVLGGDHPATGAGTILICAAGTSDLPVAEEAELTARFLGNDVQLLMDVGVAGINRLLVHAEEIAAASVVIAVAGMEGALASVVGGLASAPVIAVPTSVGYGASYGGLAALLAMLNSCASGTSVVNIDNGFGAGYQAHLINHVRVRQDG